MSVSAPHGGRGATATTMDSENATAALRLGRIHLSAPAVIRVRRAAAAALSGAAKALGGASRAVGKVAESVKPGEVTADDVAEVYEMRGRVKPPPAPPSTVTPVPAGARRPASHIEELAGRPAGEVVAQVRDLSTDELRLLLEHEQTHKRRKTVLAAIEQAAEQHAT